MALQSEISTPHGVDLAQAYSKINQFRGNRDVIYFDVLVYADSQARAEEKRPIARLNFSMPYSDGMTISSLYAYLKGLPEFARAIDV